MNIDDLKKEISRLTPDEQASIARDMSSQALLSALYDKSYNIDGVRRDFKTGRYSLLNVFDERARLRVLVEKFGAMVLAITDAQFENGEEEVNLSHMRDIVIQSMMASTNNAMQYRMQTKNLETDGRR